MRLATRTVLVLVAALAVSSARAETPETTVGMTGRIEALVLPGSELEAKPLTDRKTPVVLRVVAVYPHGTAFRYDLEFSGLEPGTHDLRDFLRRKDGSPTTSLPPIPVKVNPVLPPGQVQPNALEIEPGPRLGGYRKLLVVLIVVWGLGLAAIVFSFFYPRKKKPAEGAKAPPVSLAEKLRPLVDGAVAGRLSQAELAGLERALLAYWRKRLNLETVKPGVAIDTLRRHPEAGPLLKQLETWLHDPTPSAAVDVLALLKPYQDLPPEAIDL